MQATAQSHGLNAGILERWVTEVRAATPATSNHPLRPWLDTDTPLSVASESKASATMPATTNSPAWTLRPETNTWRASGQAFRTAESGLGTWRVGSLGLEFLPNAIAHSGRWAPNLQGTLRSPTFTLTHDHLHLRVAGRSGRVRLIIARYGLREFNPCSSNPPRSMWMSVPISPGGPSLQGFTDIEDAWLTSNCWMMETDSLRSTKWFPPTIQNLRGHPQRPRIQNQKHLPVQGPGSREGGP